MYLEIFQKISNNLAELMERTIFTFGSDKNTFRVYIAAHRNLNIGVIIIEFFAAESSQC